MFQTFEGGQNDDVARLSSSLSRYREASVLRPSFYNGAECLHDSTCPELKTQGHQDFMILAMRSDLQLEKA
jgi:hypothetical protein